MAGGAADDKGMMEPHGPTTGSATDPETGRQPDAATIETNPAANQAAKPHTEWTVSDRRGPLVAAPSAADVERIVPSSEMDAEGALDPMADSMAGPVSDSGRESERLHGFEGPVESITPDETVPGEAIPGETKSDEPVPGETIMAPESSRTDSAGSVPPPRRSLWPVAAGIVVGAVLGAASAALVYSQSTAPAPDNAKLAELSARVDALDKRPDPQAAITGLNGRIGDLSNKVAALEARGPAANSSPGAAKSSPSAPNSPVASRQASDPQVAAFGAKIAALQAAVTSAQTLAATARSDADALKAQQQTLDGKVGALQASLGGTQKQAATAQAGVDDLRGDQKALAAKLGAPALAVVADSTVEQIVGGKPFATQVDALASLGADPAKVAVLRQNAANGVPSAQALLAKFQPLADPVIATGSKAPANAGFGERLKHGLFGLVSVRRADETTGTDLPSRVALIKADLAHNDVPGAYATWTELPPDAKAKSQTWGALAKTSVEAINAARGLQAESIGSLTAKRS